MTTTSYSLALLVCLSLAGAVTWAVSLTKSDLLLGWGAGLLIANVIWLTHAYAARNR